MRTQEIPCHIVRLLQRVVHSVRHHHEPFNRADEVDIAFAQPRGEAGNIRLFR